MEAILRRSVASSQWSPLTYVGLKEEAIIVEHRVGELHDLCEDEEVLRAVGDLLRYELYEVWHQLV